MLRGNRNKKQIWTSEEDALLLEVVTRLGPHKWDIIASHFVSRRTGIQCRERWLCHVSPDISRSKFSEEEDTKLIDLVKEHGTCWSVLAGCFAGRPQSALKNRYVALVRQGKAAMPTSWRTIPGTSTPHPTSSNNRNIIASLINKHNRDSEDSLVATQDGQPEGDCSNMDDDDDDYEHEQQVVIDDFRVLDDDFQGALDDGDVGDDDRECPSMHSQHRSNKVAIYHSHADIFVPPVPTKFLPSFKELVSGIDPTLPTPITTNIVSPTTLPNSSNNNNNNTNTEFKTKQQGNNFVAKHPFALQVGSSACLLVSPEYPQKEQHVFAVSPAQTYPYPPQTKSLQQKQPQPPQPKSYSQPQPYPKPLLAQSQPQALFRQQQSFSQPPKHQKRSWDEPTVDRQTTFGVRDAWVEEEDVSSFSCIPDCSFPARKRFCFAGSFNCN